MNTNDSSRPPGPQRQTRNDPQQQQQPSSSTTTGKTTRSSGLNLLHSRPGATPIPPSLQAKMVAMANRAAPSSQNPGSSSDPTSQTFQRMAESPNLRQVNSFPQRSLQHPQSPAPPRAPLQTPRRPRPGLKLSDMDPPAGGAANAGLGAGRPNVADDTPKSFATPFANFGKIVDPSGRLNFSGKAVLHASGVDFSNGSSFAINMDQLQLDEELGRGNYGTVKKVLHRPTNVAMAMKEIRLELDSSKLNSILMELDILHRAVSPTIVEFYGAFFLESCVYYCMEYMDAGSLDRLQPAGVSEPVLARIAARMVAGLKWLKDEMQIIHRDVKPTNVLMNRKGEVKLCDFGVSGQLERSLAKTNIGCQSYMAPERIRGTTVSIPELGDVEEGSYSVSSDVWSLGLSVVEVAKGKYPYPPETYENVFAQLSAIVHGAPPDLPDDQPDDENTTNQCQETNEDMQMANLADKGKYQNTGDDDEVWKQPRRWTPEARDWVARCLVKNAADRASYAELLEHAWLAEDAQRDVDMVGWVAYAIRSRDARAIAEKRIG